MSQKNHVNNEIPYIFCPFAFALKGKGSTVGVNESRKEEKRKGKEREIGNIVDP